MPELPEITDVVDSDIYKLTLSEHIRTISNPIADELGYKPPQYYFVSSGDALSKMMFMEMDYCNLLSKLRAMPGRKARQAEKALWKSIAQIKSLIDRLRQIRGTMKFLETEWCHSVLTVTRKNPRPK